jgi:hypothetical protein
MTQAYTHGAHNTKLFIIFFLSRTCFLVDAELEGEALAIDDLVN